MSLVPRSANLMHVPNVHLLDTGLDEAKCKIGLPGTNANRWTRSLQLYSMGATTSERKDMSSLGEGESLRVPLLIGLANYVVLPARLREQCRAWPPVKDRVSLKHQ